MRPCTLREYARYRARFQRFDGTPDEFLCLLSPSQCRVAGPAIRLLLPPGIKLTYPPYKRDELQLQATVLRAQERKRLRLAPLTSRTRALLETLLVLRRCEAAQLRWEHLDLKRGVVYIPNGKGGIPGWTLLPPCTRKALCAWRLETRADGDGIVFPTRSGMMPRSDTVGEWTRKALVKAGLYRRGRGCHAFRRTFATEFLRRYPGRLRQLQVLMRHSNISTTTKYDYPRPDDLRGVVRNLHL